jgi:hypothetical protein
VSETDDLYGWDPGELAVIARWYLIRGLGLSPVSSVPRGAVRPAREADWSIEISLGGTLTCAQQTRYDQALVTEGLRLIRHAYPGRSLSLRRGDMTEHPAR